MNTILTDHIATAWVQLREATASENWESTQREYAKMARLQDLNEKSKSLEEAIAGLTPASPSFSEPAPAAARPVFHSNGTRRISVRPKELRIGGERIPIAINNQILMATANWILKQGATIPILPNFVHRDDSGFSSTAQVRRLDNGSFIEIGDSQPTLLRKARKLLDVCGFRNSKIEVHLEDGIVL